MHFTAQITDPNWGAFPITKLEEDLLATWELSRLEQIKQLGLAFLDFPSLSHTRLEHCLGVMYVAHKIFKTLRETTAERRGQFEPDEIASLFSADNEQAVRVAALLHDLGHPPFSHAIEMTFIRYPRLLKRALKGMKSSHSSPEEVELFADYSHERFTRWIIVKSPALRRVIDDHFNGRISVEAIAALAVGEAEGTKLGVFNHIITGDFDADRIDYLIRDNRRSGFAIGLAPDELYNAVYLHRGRKKAGLRRYEIYIDRTALPFVNSVLGARERLIRRVHLAPYGRTATQMLIKFLYEDLDSIEEDSELAETIIFLHKECTDYSFFARSRSRIKRMGARDFGKGVIDLITRTSKRVVWPEYASLDFMRMQPCLRLLAYLSAKAGYDSPNDLVIAPSNSAGKPGNRHVFIEPSTRAAPRFSLRVDYDCKPKRPGFDFIASTENWQGRAILAQSLSNVDVFSYQMGVGSTPVLSEEALVGELPQSATVYTENLKGREALLGKFIVRQGHRVKSLRDPKRGMFPSEFLLTVLYCLQKSILKATPEARGIYVYRAEEFINRFMPSLAKRKPPHFPAELDRPVFDANKVFTELQRVEVFGLVETRRRPLFHSEAAVGSARGGRTRRNVFSSREDFRISMWGRHYVESDIDRAKVGELCAAIEERQRPVMRDLIRMAIKYSRAAEVSADVQKMFSYHDEWNEIAPRFKNACLMMFSLPPAMDRKRSKRTRARREAHKELTVPGRSSD